jgi:hypothetical protein
MNFGQAIQALKEGERVARTGWNGKGMWLAYVPAGYMELTNGLEFPSCPYLVMKTAQATVVPWLASQTDVLAEDWVIV